MQNDTSLNLTEQVNNALKNKSPLMIFGGNSKNFYGNRVEGEAISTAGHTGIIEYQPSELVITVRSGTLLSELEAELKNNKQMLAFEPPQHSENSTIGGIIACGLSGPRRTSCGAARDFVLGTTIINGKAEKLRFGGQVMKNVAGYDASRLMTGAQGTLGILLDISLKVLPLNENEITLKIIIDLNDTGKQIQAWIKQGLPVTASCFLKDTLYMRLGSTHSAVKKSVTIINQKFTTEEVDNDFWQLIKNQSHDFFTHANNLWRCSHQATTDFYETTEDQLIEWNGALRWIDVSKSSGDKNLHPVAEQYHGHALRYPIANNDETTSDIFQPLTPALLKVHQRLKHAFDPEKILNPGRLYRDI